MVDAHVSPSQIEAFYLGNFAGPSFTGQNHLAPYIAGAMGISGVPCTRFEAACASSGSAFFHAVSSVGAGLYDLALIGGVEKMTSQPTPKVTEILAGAGDMLGEGRAGAASGPRDRRSTSAVSASPRHVTPNCNACPPPTFREFRPGGKTHCRTEQTAEIDVASTEEPPYLASRARQTEPNVTADKLLLKWRVLGAYLPSTWSLMLVGAARGLHKGCRCYLYQSNPRGLFTLERS